MASIIETFLKPFLKKKTPDIRPGDTVRVYQRVFASSKNAKEKNKEKLQVFEGLVIARKHKKEAGATITVRKVISGVGVEKIFPLHSPLIEKIEIIKRSKVRRAKLYYLREAKGKKARLKKLDLPEEVVFSEPPKKEEVKEEDKESEQAKKEEQEGAEKERGGKNEQKTEEKELEKGEKK